MEQVRTRIDIRTDIAKKQELIGQLELEIDSLEKEDILFCDESQWFEEKEEEIVLSNRPKKTEKRLIGRIYWKEEFKDEDTKRSIWIERSYVVRDNGEWVV